MKVEKAALRVGSVALLDLTRTTAIGSIAVVQALMSERQQLGSEAGIAVL